MIRTVRLYGKLGAAFGRVHHFNLDSDSPAEAIRALSSQFDGFRAWLMGASDRGITFSVFRGKENIGEDDLTSRAGADIRIAPVLMGRKSGGMGQFIEGAVLFVVGAVISYFSYGTLAAVGTSLMYSGAAMMIGGVVQMLSPQPKLKSGRESSNQPSYVFNGAVNTEAQGHPVPLCYGRMRVGSAVISAGIEADDYAAATPGANTGVAGGNLKKNYYDTVPA